MIELYLTLVDTDKNRDKLTKIYEKYKRLIKYIALKVYDNDEFAEDVTHDTIITLIGLLNRNKIGEVDCDKTKSLVATVAKRTALNKLARDKKISYIDQEKLVGIADSSDGYSAVFANDLVEAIKNMPDIYREVLELFALHDMSPRMIASVLKIKEATVRKRLQRARDMVKNILDKSE